MIFQILTKIMIPVVNMRKKILMAFLIFVLIVCGLYVVYLIDEAPSQSISSSDRVTLTVASEGPFDVDRFCQDVRTNPYYKGYDNGTVEWLENYKDCQILTSSDAFVVIDKAEIGKIPILNANDVFINETFECNIVENRSLGDEFKDVLIVKNIDYKNETIKSMIE